MYSRGLDIVQVLVIFLTAEPSCFHTVMVYRLPTGSYAVATSSAGIAATVSVVWLYVQMPSTTVFGSANAASVAVSALISSNHLYSGLSSAQ